MNANIKLQQTRLDDHLASYYETRDQHPRIKALLEGRDEAFLRKGLDVRDSLVRWLGGVPRLEKSLTPVNAESNDLYQFRMASIFHEESPEKRGSYVLYYRRPKDMGGVVLAGIEQAIDSLEQFRLDPRFLHKLRSENKITEGLYQELLKMDHLDIEVEAIPEGTFVGPNTPVMTVTGPLWQVQLVETVLLQCLDYSTGVATRAAAIVEASGGKPLVDFGARRAPGEQAAILSAFSSIKGGAGAVANTLASYLSQALPDEDYFPDLGTTAHAYTEAYLKFDPDGNILENPADGEESAYTDWIKYFPESTCVLIDTIHKKVGLQTTAKIYEKLGFREEGKKIGVRDDSVISAESVMMVFDELTALGVDDFFIVISDSLNPNKVRAIREGVTAARGEQFWEELDIRFGVGTYLARPEPTGFVFKLAEHAEHEDAVSMPVSKASGDPEKASFSVTKTYRLRDKAGQLIKDMNLAPDEDPKALVKGTSTQIEALAQHAFSAGRRLVSRESARAIADRWSSQVPNIDSKHFGGAWSTYRPQFSTRISGVRERIQHAFSQAGAGLS